MPHADLDGRQLFYLRRGGGDPMLMITGLSGNHGQWGEPFLGALDSHFELIPYDHRGVGHSSPLDGAFTIADLADDAAALLAALSLESAHVVGISMGGMVAQELALRHPGAVRTLTLGCTYCGGAGGSLLAEEKAQRLVALAYGGDREALLRFGWELNVSAAYAADEANWRRFAEIARYLPASIGAMLAQMQAIAGHDTSERLHEIAAPTLLLHGTEDQMVPFDNAALIADRIPNARLEVLDGVGHLFFVEQPERSAALVRELALTPQPG